MTISGNDDGAATRDLEEAKRLCAAATPGPWKSGCDPSHFHAPEIQIAGACLYIPTDADARFIAAARTLVPELIAEVERLRAENEELGLRAALAEHAANSTPQ